MAQTSIQKFSNMPALELKKHVLELRGKLWQSKLDLASGKVKNIASIRMLKKDIARALTVIRRAQPDAKP